MSEEGRRDEGGKDRERERERENVLGWELMKMVR